MASKSGAWHTTSAKVEIKSPIGAGDSFVGAFALALSRGEAPENCLRYGAAAASAACTSEATELCSLEDVERLQAQCVISKF